MNQNTHLKIDNKLNGKIIHLDKGYAKVELKTIELMRADEEGLVHGGFCFGAADFAAMVAVNDPFVVLSKSQVMFLAPVKVGEVVEFEAKIIEDDRRKYKVEVIGLVLEKEVFRGVFDVVVLKDHVLKL